MKAAWVTDPHLNHVSGTEVREFAEKIKATGADLCFITGDIAESPSFEWAMKILMEHCGMPVHFVLGNHDFWHSSMRETRDMVRDMSNADIRMTYLGEGKVMHVTSDTILMGVDGWYDGLAGVGSQGGTLRLWDSTYVEDLRLPTEFQHSEMLRDLGKDSAVRVALSLGLANEYPYAKNWILLTHVPPFRDASWHNGRIGDDMAAPLFVNMQMGERLRYLMEFEYPDKKLTVLCGHTHSQAIYQPIENLIVKCGGAVYGAPEIQEIIEL